MSLPLFDSNEALQAAIEEYFKQESGKVTITGLCYFLGFESRQSFYDYEKDGRYSYTIKRARLFIESHYEKMLSGNSVSGAIFALKNFGWTDKTELEHSGNLGITVNLEDGTDA